jgi:hemolysin activation/secretion protein
MGAAFAVGGQYSADILPVPEKISFGSTRFGRGYQAGEFSGDSGMGASAELNYQFLINQAWIKSAEPYLLYEWARTHQQTSGVRAIRCALPAWGCACPTAATTHWTLP